MVTRMLSLLFGCRHRRLTRPITPARKPRSQPATAYVACLDCGKRFHYDVEHMRMGAAIHPGAAGVEASHFQSQT